MNTEDFSSSALKEDMNPLDLLAEVAVSCSDDEKNPQVQHCDDFMEPEAEFNKISKETPNTCQEDECTQLAPQDGVTCNDVSIAEQPQIQECQEESGIEDDITTESEALGDNDSPFQPFTQTNDAVKSETSYNNNNDAPAAGQPFVQEVLPKESTCDPLEKTQTVDPKPVAKHTAVCTVASVSPSIEGCQLKYLTPGVKTLASDVNTKVTRLLSPNFKLTMTDTLPLIHRRKYGSSLLIGNLGSTTITMMAPTTKAAGAKPQKTKLKTARRYPNLELGKIPKDYPLLDHDYCYQNFYDIVLASRSLEIKQEPGTGTTAAVGESMLGKSTDMASNPGGKPKRKYRTKRIIAEELEAQRRAELRAKADQGDEDAKKELDEIFEKEEQARIEAEMKNKRRNKKKNSTFEVDSEEELLNEIAEDECDQVQDHDPSFKDQFVYFGSKKYKSKRRHLDVKEDPYQSFWKTGQLNNTKCQSQKVSMDLTAMRSSETTELSLDACQEINDVFDVLGISPRVSEDGEAGNDHIDSTDVAQVSRTSSTDSALSSVTGAEFKDTQLNQTIDKDNVDENSRCAESEPQVPTSIVNDSDDNNTADSAYASLQQHDSLCMDQEILLTEADAANDEGLDELLQSITMDQVSQLILALEEEPTSSNHNTNTGKNETLTPSGIEIKTLAALAKDVCNTHNITLPASEQDNHLSQMSQTSNLSLDLSEADLLVSDKNINLDLLTALSATPPKPPRLNTPVSTPDRGGLAPSHLPISSATTSSPSTNSWSEEAFKSPMVVPVTMYWNTFPALLVDGVKYVRLIDISRQALPSKETGLLKKRAQGLGYEVINCTDLQRNLLVKYAFACPSRSNLMVSEAGAAEVIASYMEKSEIEELSKAPELPCLQLPADVTSTTTTTVRAPAEPVTLMPQVLIEHKPLQQSSSSGKRTPSNSSDPAVPERSSRLRQIKSSYRRFLSLNSSSSSHAVTNNSSTPKGEGLGVIEENASDRGYHSDQSPDSVVSKPVTAKRNKKSASSKKPKSVRRSLTSQESNSSVDQLTLDIVTDDCVIADIESPSPSSDEAQQRLTVMTTLLSPSPSVAASSSCGLSPRSSLDDSMLQLTEPESSLSSTSPVVLIRHIDLVPRHNGKQSSQDGELFMQFFKSLHSPCIKCCTCRQFLTLKAFTKHQHIKQKLGPVKVRQRIEARGISVDSELWQDFKRTKKLYETTRSPLKKLSETRLSKPDSANTANDLFHSRPEIVVEEDTPTPTRAMGKRIPKQKKLNPDEVYYSNPCITNTTRKRKAEAEYVGDEKRRASASTLGLRKHIGR